MIDRWRRECVYVCDRERERERCKRKKTPDLQKRDYIGNDTESPRERGRMIRESCASSVYMYGVVCQGCRCPG